MEVLGTSFNINSYSDELGKTSLISGAIKIKGNILKPGQAFQRQHRDKNRRATGIWPGRMVYSISII